MKIQKLRNAIMAVIGSMLIFSACQKEVSTNFSEETQVKNGGVVPDDPAVVRGVPLIISSHLIKQEDLSSETFASGYFRGKGGKSGSTGNGRDKTPPSVTITSPSDGSTVNGAVDVTVIATDNVGVTSVSLSIDGGSAVSTSTVDPFTNTWNSATVPNGTHTLTVTAYDAAGKKGTSSVQINVNNATVGDITPPIVSFISPDDQSTVTGTVTISINATDNVGVSSTSISIDNVVVSNSTSYIWDASTANSGYHTLKAVAKDAAGNQGSSSIQVSINTTIIDPPTSTTTVELTMPPVGNQGSEGACVAFAVGYATRSAEWYYKTGAGSYSYSTNIFSPEFLYDMVKPQYYDCNSGMSVQKGIDFLVTSGICTFQSMPYSSSNGCSLVATADQLAEALNFRIAGYSKVSILDRTAIKAMIDQHHPVITTILADNSFVNAKSGFIWDHYSGSGSLPHCIAIVGYDDSKNAYKIMNSWGTSWGDGGFSWIDYDFYETGGYTAGNGWDYVIY